MMSFRLVKFHLVEIINYSILEFSSFDIIVEFAYFHISLKQTVNLVLSSPVFAGTNNDNDIG